MKKNKKDILKVVLVTLIAIFLMVCVASLLYANHKKKLEEERKKQDAIDALESVPTATPTLAATATPTPKPTATPTPTPSVTRPPAFSPEDYYGAWYSTDGTASIDIYDLTLKSVSFTFSQEGGGEDGSISEADVTAEVAGNAAKLSLTDGWGNIAEGTMTFDQGRLYLKIKTTRQNEEASVYPDVDCIMAREQREIQKSGTETEAGAELAGDYIFPDSDSRYLTEEELSRYTSSQLELAKNEIYARHGRKFVTERISAYFNSKSWYNGTIDAETFDSMSSVFNEYEEANIQKIAEMEEKKRSEGN